MTDIDYGETYHLKNKDGTATLYRFKLGCEDAQDEFPGFSTNMPLGKDFDLAEPKTVPAGLELEPVFCRRGEDGSWHQANQSAGDIGTAGETSPDTGHGTGSLDQFW
ncbi:hypothetical protein FHS85_002079 [Rhodoligotrophos appendicifer]|uniref:hypothetical protein n=1 Tax=Rhodoligotrophos appendicifer TaxID=987056 RepID=UPI001184A970|nr:hypothetical protein [Rhodoligotrophos appendicifer]